MVRWGVAGHARHLTDRLRRVPFLLVKTELEALLGVLHSDEVTSTLLRSLVHREQKNLGAHASAFIKGAPYPRQVGLSFANSPERRAAFGYQVLTGLLDGSPSPEEVSNKVVGIGARYAWPGQHEVVPPTECMSHFIDIFLEPVIDYLEGAQNSDDLVLATMVRYKRRAEWFERERLWGIAWHDENAKPGQSADGGKGPTGQAEQRLKQEFYQYLFDQGLEFVIEAQSPKRGGVVDIVTAKLADGRRLIVEAKVHDGARRDEHWVSNGIKQAASYAEEWGEPRAYLLVYNVVENSLLSFVSVRQEDNFWVTSSLGREVVILGINLGVRLPASQGSQLSVKTIDLA